MAPWLAAHTLVRRYDDARKLITHFTIMNILIISTLAIVLMAWATYERDNRLQGFPDRTVEPYEMEDRDN